MPVVRRFILFPFAAILVLYTLYHFSQQSKNWSPAPDIVQVPSPTSDKLEWGKLRQLYPVTSFIPLPTGKPVKIPKIQHEFGQETPEAKATRLERQKAVKDEFIHGWNGYKSNAWLHDEVAPLQGGYRDTFGGWAATLVDTLDTLWIMDMQHEFEAAVTACVKIDFSNSTESILNVFETVIRYLGGFLAAYDLSDGKYPILLDKAVDLGDMVYYAFDTPNRMPNSRWNWRDAARGKPQAAPDRILVSELGSFSLEFTRLSQLSGDPKYYDAIQRISNEFEKSQYETKLPGLWPIMVNAGELIFSQDSTFTLGGMADSLYEYFPKEYLLLGGLVKQYKSLYEGAIETAKQHLFYRPMNEGDKDILVSGNARVSSMGNVGLEAQGQHLTCFTGGMVGIGAKIFDRPDDLSIARKLVDGCFWAYDSTASGIMPEVFHALPCKYTDSCPFDRQRWYDTIRMKNPEKEGDPAFASDNLRAESIIASKRLPPGFLEMSDTRYILRPEHIESVWILYRITGDTSLQDHGWKLFQSIIKVARTPIAHAGIEDVRMESPAQSDRMESFWLAETLKYYYLLFSEPDLISLDEYVLNTEAHPFKRPQ